MSGIVVGVDGSPGSDAALRWAVREARLRGSSLRIVHAYPIPSVPVVDGGLGPPGGIALPALAEEDEQVRRSAEEHARAVIEGPLRRVGDDLGGLEVEQSAVPGPPTQALIDSARGAELLVVGSRGRGGFLGLLLGSVSQQLTHHPPCPLVILPPPDDAGSAGDE